MLTGLLLCLCWWPVQEGPEAPRQDPIAVTTTIAAPDDSEFRKAMEERIRREQPELSDEAVAEMARGILEIRARVADSNSESPATTVEARIANPASAEPQPLQMELKLEPGNNPGERRVVGMRLTSPNQQGPQRNPLHMLPPQVHGAGPHPMHQGQGGPQGQPPYIAPQWQGGGMVQVAPQSSVTRFIPLTQTRPAMGQGQGTDAEFASHLRDAARRLDQGAADLEDRGAYDLADQMRQIAQQLRQQARQRHGAHRGAGPQGPHQGPHGQPHQGPGPQGPGPNGPHQGPHGQPHQGPGPQGPGPQGPGPQGPGPQGPGPQGPGPQGPGPQGPGPQGPGPQGPGPQGPGPQGSGPQGAPNQELPPSED